MNERGERTGPLACYGCEFDKPYQLVRKVFRAWEVQESYLINGCEGYDDREEPRTPKITTDGGPAYMLKFGDGKWRYASFKGLNGPPWTYCEAKPYEGKTGREAWLRRRINGAKQQREYAEAQLKQAERKLNTLMSDLELHLAEEAWK